VAIFAANTRLAFKFNLKCELDHSNFESIHNRYSFLNKITNRKFSPIYS